MGADRFGNRSFGHFGRSAVDGSKKGLRIRMSRLLIEIRHRIFFHDFSGVHHRSTLAQFRRQTEIMGN
jgi:hypothetical protein